MRRKRFCRAGWGLTNGRYNRGACLGVSVVRGMIALSLTIFVSLSLALFFVGLFVMQVCEGGGQPQDVLMPLEGESAGDTEPRVLGQRGGLP